MQPLGIPEWLLSITLGGIDNLLRCHRLLTPGPKARLFLQKAAQCFKATNRNKRLPYCDNFTIGREKGNESNGEKEMENRKGRRNVGFSRGSLTLLYTLEKGKTKKPYKLYTKPYTNPTSC